MEQYIYANVKREAYKMVSSSPEFFGNVRNATLMRHLINHDNHCTHGELKPWEHQSFWMVTTDMDRPGEVPRLFLQASGGDDHRDGIYVHGYMCEVPKSQMSIYEQHLSKILSLTFLDKDGALKTAEALTLPSITLQETKSNADFAEMEVAPEILKYIILELMGRRKVIIRIPTTGKQAMMDSRRLLLTIYNRLPYDYRASTGFITGTSLSALTNQQNPLPGAVNLIVLDGDSDISTYRARPSQVLIDIDASTQKFNDMEKISPICKQMISYLVDENSDNRIEFFEFAKKLKEILKPTQRMELSDYLPVYQMYSAIHGNLTETSVKYMAVLPYATPNWNSRINDFYSKMLADRITSDQILHYFESQINSFSAFTSFGEIDKVEYEKIRLDKSGSMEIQDKSFGLVIHMLETIIPFYQDSEMERAQLVQGLSAIFKQKAFEELEWITEPKPTSKTVDQLNQLRFPDFTGDPSIVSDVKKDVSLTVSQKQEEIRSLYQQNYQMQAQSGSAAIAAWPGDKNCRIQELFDSLRNNNYLYDELIDGGTNSWNFQIIQRIQLVFNEKSPEDVDGFTVMQEDISDVLEFYEQNLPNLKTRLEKELYGRQNWCQKAIDLDQQSCGSLTELLDLMTSVNNLKYSKTFSDCLMQKWTSQISGIAIEWCDIQGLIQRICAAGVYEENRVYLQSVLSRCSGLLTIPDKMKDDEAITRLRHLENLEKAQLLPGEIYSERLKKNGSAADIKQDYIRIRDESWRKNRPFKSIAKGWDKWGADDTRDYNKSGSYQNGYYDDYQYNPPVTDKKKTEYGMRPKTEYSYGTSAYGSYRQNEKAYQPDNKNVKASFGERKIKRPSLPQIPDLEPLIKKQGRGCLIATGTLLTGFSGAIPAAALFLQEASMMNSGITAAALVASLTVLEAASFAVHGKTRKVLMRSMGASLIPGILGSTAALILLLR